MNPHTLETPADEVCCHCNLKLNDVWILHKVQRPGVMCDICTNCVLKLNSFSFCQICLSVYDRPKKPSSIPGGPSFFIIQSTLSCFKCGSLCHTSCVPPNTPKSSYLCPTCSNPHFKFFEFRRLSINERTNRNDRREVVIDDKASKAVRTAAKIVYNIIYDGTVRVRMEMESFIRAWAEPKSPVSVIRDVE